MKGVISGAGIPHLIAFHEPRDHPFKTLTYLGPSDPLCSPFGYGWVLELVRGTNPYFFIPASWSEGHIAHVKNTLD